MFFLVWLCICINSYSSWQKKLSIMLYLEAYICVPLKRQRTNSLWILFFSFSIRSCNKLYFHFLFLDLLSCGCRNLNGNLYLLIFCPSWYVYRSSHSKLPWWINQERWWWCKTEILWWGAIYWRNIWRGLCNYSFSFVNSFSGALCSCICTSSSFCVNNLIIMIRSQYKGQN